MYCNVKCKNELRVMYFISIKNNIFPIFYIITPSKTFKL